MEKKLNCCLMLSLKDITLRRVSVLLWSKTDILLAIDKFKAKDKVEAYILELKLPPLLTKQMKSLTKHMYFEITDWRIFLKKYLDTVNGRFSIRILEKVCWTVLGTIDYPKTAEKLILNEMFDRVKIYKLACLYCLEDYIPDLFEKLPEVNKRAFYREGLLRNRFLQPALQFCWPFILKGEEDELDRMAKRIIGNSANFNQYAFEYAAGKGNITATKYFFRKLKDNEIEASLSRAAKAALKYRLEDYKNFDEETFPKGKLSETIFYLLSQMDHEKKLEILKEYACHVFTCFLDWPWEELFFDISLFTWPYLLETGNERALAIVAQRITATHSFSETFQELFQLSPTNLRKRFVDKECQSGFFRGFFKNQNLEVIKIIFRNIDLEDRKRLLCCDHVFRFFYESISEDNFHFVKQCFQEANLSNEDKVKLKESYLIFLTKIDTMNINRREKTWEKFLPLLN